MHLCIYESVSVPPTSYNACQGLDRSKYPKSRYCPLEWGHHQTPAQETSDSMIRQINNISKNMLQVPNAPVKNDKLCKHRGRADLLYTQNTQAA